MRWTLSCNNKTFTNKLSAIREQVASNQGLYFHTPKAYDDYDFTIEPKLSLEELCKQKALQLREENDKIVIWYSGGCDSHYVLNTFLQNKIPVDEIVMVKSGFSKADFEIDEYALPFAKSTGIKITVHEPTIDYYNKYYLNKEKMLGTANGFWHHFRLNNHFENVQHHDLNGVAHIFGNEKPTLCFNNSKWYTYFLDAEVSPQPHQINFFCDDPIIHSKQCHMLINNIQLHKNQNEYNQITFYDKHQDFWNQSIGRYKKNNFPLKNLSIGKNYNNKDTLAIEQASDELVNAWQERNNDLVKELGITWFNQGNPTLGTVGVFSKFYCLTEKDTKTVDELFPNGFNPQ